jgi:hypothetical protein
LVGIRPKLINFDFFGSKPHTLSCRRSTVRAISSCTKTLLVTGLGVRARLLGGTTCALIKDVALVDGILLIALWIVLEIW